MKPVYISKIGKHLLMLVFAIAFGSWTVMAQDDEIQGAENEESLEQVQTQNIRTVLPYASEPTDAAVHIQDNQAVFQGDMVLGPVAEIAVQGGRGGVAIAGRRYRWPNGTIPYEIEANHPRRADIIAAIEKINRETVLNMVPRNGQRNYLVYESEDGACRAQLGRRGGRQWAKIGNSTRCRNGSIIHETFHAAGLLHEHTRPDRDTHVTIDINNVRTNARGNFTKRTTSNSVTLGTSYNFESIMHYGPYAFAVDRSKKTITRKSGTGSYGQRRYISAGDKAMLRALYPPATTSTGSTASGSTNASESWTDMLSRWLGMDDPDMQDLASGASDDGSSSSSSSSSSGGSSTNRINIVYQVRIIPQATSVSCWAASAAMLLNWADPTLSVTPEEIARGSGNWQYYNQGGLPADNQDLFDAWLLQTEDPMSYTVAGFADLLRSYGPLWVASAEPLGGANSQDPHARVVVGMIGDGTPDGTTVLINDPWEQGMRSFSPPNRGSSYRETYREFMRKQHNLANQEMNVARPIYIAHN